jgi:protein phosphatase
MPGVELDGFGRMEVTARVAGATHAGQRRPENQDNFVIGELAPTDRTLVLRPEAGNAGGVFEVGAGGILMMVADGMGGAAAGSLASGLACTFVLAELQQGWAHEREHLPRAFAARLRDALRGANRRIRDHARRHPETSGMGTTATVGGVLDGFLYLAQVGDSRAYLIRQGVATQLTRDQSVVQELIEVGALTPEEAAHHAHGNVILQSLGTADEVRVDLTYQELRRGDTILLCSDGLHRVQEPADLAAAVGLLDDPAEICNHLIAAANERGGPDNVTVVAARLDGQALAEPGPEDSVGRTVLDLPDRAAP